MGKPPRKTTPKGGMGAPKENVNAIRHGLTSGNLPKGAKYIQHQMDRLRRQLEAAVIEAKGQVTLSDAAAIQSAIRWERHSALALRWLRVEGDKLKPTDRLTFSREIARASAERDKAIRELKLDRDTHQDMLKALYSLGGPNESS